MPELPETETIARDLDAAVSGETIEAVAVTHADVLREVTSRALRSRVTGATIVRCWRRAKLIVVDLSTGDRIVVQPRFTGALLIDDGGLPESERRYSTVEFLLSDGRRLHYRDIRRLGTLALMDPARFAGYTSALGVEPLDSAFTVEHLSSRLRGSRQAIKKVLMDQRALAGVGNIYANESLWRAGIDPSRAAGSLSTPQIARLHNEIVEVLRASIEARGTSFRDYRDASGQRGRFAEQLQAYGRAGEPCARCGHRLIGTHAVDGRMTVLCAHCQS
ncbi:MAG TPA: bifunctional DNA-formamidopyrimidine glycosylase/DNA-(apurinic or apyrimidinic site) lyase [Gemmatimonadaceae bacterium]|nr:bifunctional DNA-formamidopyrimidine glycosylase/DNA-(apurinic or apyrimidinic site) lyase [Gemmatimonadaceae bacterium]